MPETLRFTKPVVDALPVAPPGKRVTYHDADQEGLVLRVTDTGTKTYSVFMRLKKGNPERVTIGTSTKITPTQAREAARQAIAKLGRGESQVATNKALKAESTLNELMSGYFDRSVMKPRSLAEATRLHQKYIQDQLGKLKLSKVDQKAVARLHSDITLGRVPGFKGGPVTANRVVATLKAAYNWAASAGLWIGDNPASKIKKNAEASRERYVESHELAKFFEAVNLAPEPARSFFLIAVLTGARRSNVSAMRWADIDMEFGLWTVPGELTKGGDALKIPLVPEALAVLERRLEATGGGTYVLPGSGKAGHYREPKRAWATVCRRAGLTDLTIHDLRRTLGSWLVRTGASTAINMKALGHKSMAAAAVYQRIADTDPVRDAVAKATSAILAGAGLVLGRNQVVSIRGGRS